MVRPYLSNRELRAIFSENELQELGISFIHNVLRNNKIIKEIMIIDMKKCPQNLINLTLLVIKNNKLIQW